MSTVRRTRVAVVLAVACAALGGVAAAGRSATPAAAAAIGYHGTIRLTVADLQDYWAQTLPDVYGVRYRRLPANRIIPYTSHSKIPQCGRGHATYKDVAENAFYCTGGGFLAYDDEHLFPELDEKWGDFTIALTLAHEWGHYIQDQTDTAGDTIYLEQQADCFAGAWVRWVDDGNSNRLFLRPGNLDTAHGGFLDFRDPPGSDPTAEGAHGSAFDRIGAFQDGFDGGAAKCADYENDLPTIVEIPFSSDAEAAAGGDVPFKDVIPLTTHDLDLYWSQLLTSYTPVQDVLLVDPRGTLPRCGGTRVARGQIADTIFYCIDSNEIMGDENLLHEVYDNSGDFGVAVLIAQEWGVALQHQFDEQGTAKQLALERVCFAGSWAGSVVRGDHDPGGLTLSSGDLDEAVQSFLIFASPVKEDDPQHASAFENVAAFRSGFFQGEQACLALVD
jgi:predicted metalloprotease